MKNRGGTLYLINVVEVHTGNTKPKFEENPCNGWREVEKVIKFATTTNTR